MIIHLNIKLQDEYCKKCKFLCIHTVRNVFYHQKEVDELINFIENNPFLSSETIQYYEKLGIELKDLQYGEATAFTIAQLIVDLLNKIDEGGMYRFYCYGDSKYCQSIGYSCFYKND